MANYTTSGIPDSLPESGWVSAYGGQVAKAVNDALKGGKVSFDGKEFPKGSYSDYKTAAGAEKMVNTWVRYAILGTRVASKEDEIISFVKKQIKWESVSSQYSPQLFEWPGSLSAHVSTWVGMTMTANKGKIDDGTRKAFYTYITSRTGDVAVDVSTAKVYAIYPDWKYPSSSKSTASESINNATNVIVATAENIAAVTTLVEQPVVSTSDTFAKISSMAERLKFNTSEKRAPKISVKGSSGPFSPDGDSTIWYDGNSSKSPEDLNNAYNSKLKKTGYISKSMFDGSAERQTPVYIQYTGTSGTKIWDSNEFKAFLLRRGYSKSEVQYLITQGKKRGISKANVMFGPAGRAEYLTSWDSESRRNEMLNGDADRMQNSYNFPFMIKDANTSLRNPVKAEYSFQIVPNDPRLPSDSPILDLEDRLRDARAALGIPVHGNNDIARSMKMYMYNRFKVPDPNLAHIKTTTHVFFTRPDLNLLEGVSTANQQVVGHTDTALLWRRYPEIFKLLTDYSRCGDKDNLNLLLSNQVTSFNLDDERLATIRGGKSWAEHEMVYGEQYTGRTAGEFTCSFDETSEFSIINMMKLWITYIDNVSRGAWSPWYPHNSDGKVNLDFDERCHVYERALDYAASAYVFKCDPTGDEILYWSKYYGVFPIVTGSSALGWEKSGSIGDGPKLNITFAYSFKKDLSPISLLEFNHAANATDDMEAVPGYEWTYGGSHRPFVGSPYIEINLGAPAMDPDSVNIATKRTTVKLKFRKDTDNSRNDDILYKTNIGKPSVYTSSVPGATYRPNNSSQRSGEIRSQYAGSSANIYELNKAMAEALIVKW